jgi:GUN4-like/NACHT domain
MPETPNLPEAKASDGEKSAPEKSWNKELGGVIVQFAKDAGMGTLLKSALGTGMGVGVGAFITLLAKTDLPTKLVGGVLGGAAPIGYAIVAPTGKKMKKGADVLGEGIATVVEDKTKAVAAKVLGDDDRYLELQREECQTACCDGINQIFVPLLEEIFVPLSISFDARRGGWDELDDPESVEEVAIDRASEQSIWPLLKAAEQKSACRQMAILAWGGYGKTTLLRHITYIYSSNQQGKYKAKAKIPVFLPLKTFGKIIAKSIADNRPIDLPELIQKHHLPYLSDELVLPLDWAKNKLSRGEMVVLLDGLDEVADVIRPQVTRWLKDELRQYGKSKSIFILTSRPKAYTDQPKDSGDRLEMRMTVWVEPFTPDQQDAFVRRWYGYQETYANNGRSTSDVTRRADQKATALLSQIRDRPEINDLAKIPLLLNMIATFHRLSPTVTLPRRRVELYQSICQLQLRDRPGAKELDTLLTKTDAQVILQRLAFGMMVPQREKTIGYPALVQRLADYLKVENEKVDTVAFLKEVVRVSELLVEREEREYEFAHWSFQEYLAAGWIFDQKLESEISSRLDQKEWQPLILMYVGMLKNPSELMQQMLDCNLMALAGACLKETTKQVDADVLRALEGIAGKVTDARYAKLEALLKAGEWREADQETYRVMIQVVGKEEGQGFSRQDLETFPCEDLLTIDKLWDEASNGHFGFSVQKKIWEQCGSPMSYNNDYKKFMTKVGWRKGEDFVSYQDFKFSPIHSPSGELPKLWDIGGGFVVDCDFGVGVGLFSRIATCGGVGLFSRIATCEL